MNTRRRYPRKKVTGRTATVDKLECGHEYHIRGNRSGAQTRAEYRGCRTCARAAARAAENVVDAERSPQ